MEKSTKSKKAEFEVKPIKEPDFITMEKADPTAGVNKKLLAQLERDKRDQEAAKINKEKQEAEKKKKNKSNKTKTKQNQTQTQIKEKEVTSVKTEFEPKTNIDERRDSLKNLDSSNSNKKIKWRDSSKNVEKFDCSNLNNKFGQISFTFNDGKNDKEFQDFLKNWMKYAGKIREEKGDLFTAPNEYSLAHCVAEDFSMGAGIAKQFMAKFKGVSKLLQQNAITGGLAVLPDKERFIYYLVTKRYSNGKPTLYTLWKSLLKLRDHIAIHKVTKLAIPQIGCGLDRLDWTEVKQMLEYVFHDNDIEIVVYILDFNPDDSLTQSKTLRKAYVVHRVMPLIEIESQTGLIFFGSEDSSITYEMECLSKKYNFINEYKKSEKSIGDVLKYVDQNEYLYGLIIRRSTNNRINFEDFERCLIVLRKILKTDQTNYIALQGFVENEDVVITEKIITLMQYILVDLEIWVCWPEELGSHCSHK